MVTQHIIPVSQDTDAIWSVFAKALCTAARVRRGVINPPCFMPRPCVGCATPCPIGGASVH